MKILAARISSLHRILLVASSVVLGVVGSRVATDPQEWASWALLLACGSLLFIADVGRHVDDKARIVAAAARVALPTARRDVVSTGESRAIAIGTAIAIVCIVVSAVATWLA